MVSFFYACKVLWHSFVGQNEVQITAVDVTRKSQVLLVGTFATDEKLSGRVGFFAVMTSVGRPSSAGGGGLSLDATASFAPPSHSITLEETSCCCKCTLSQSWLQLPKGIHSMLSSRRTT